MNSLDLYRTWNSLLKQWVPDTCPTRLRNMAWLIVGLFLARSVYASAIVKKWPMPVQVTSLTRRLSRFLDNPNVSVRWWYRALAEQIVARWRGGRLTLILDASKVGFGHQLLMLAVAYKRRALPLVWCWLDCAKGHSSAHVQVAWVAYARGLIAPDTQVTLVGDAEFGNVGLMRQLTRCGWQYALRQKGSHQVAAYRQRRWHARADLVTGPGQSVWWAQARLPAKWAFRTNVFASWAHGEDDPWLLATNLPDRQSARRVYAQRMWVEEMFGDLKDHGFDLEATHLRHFLRLSRLTLAICLLYVWLVLRGQRVIQTGQRAWVDRRERRDLSLFRIGFDFIERCLVLGRSFPSAFFMPLSGG